VYDYVDGKSDWMAYGLAVEGVAGPFLGEALTVAPTCPVRATVAEARAAVGDTGETVVVVDPEGLALGVVGAEALAQHRDADLVLDIMSAVPSTVRPSAELSSLVDSGADRVLVTSSDGHLLGQVVLAGTTVSDLPNDHDHQDDEDHVHDQDDEMDALFDETMAALRERFGDRDPSAEELRAFLRDRLMAAGRSAEEADGFLREMDEDEEPDM
jgi:hypothetical protein